MQHSEMLAGLVAQAEAEGADLLMIRAMIEEASMIGAERALERLGLADAGAEKDVRELRELIGGWRDARKVAQRAVIGWLTRILIMLLLLGLAYQADLLPAARA